MTAFNYSTGNPADLTGGANADMADIKGSFDDLRTFLNGGNLDGTNITAAIQQALIPAGSILMTGGATADAGFLLCDGSAVSRVTYATLFSRIGTTYGSGDGSTTFNVPDMRSRVPVGAGQGSGLTNRTLGSSGGIETWNQQIVVTTGVESGVPKAIVDFNMPPYRVVNFQIKT